MDRPVDPADPASRGDEAIIFYDGRIGYMYKGIKGTSLTEAVLGPLTRFPGLTLEFRETTPPGSVQPVWSWKGWRFWLVDEHGLPVYATDTLYAAMYFVWEPADAGVPPETPADELRSMLCSVTRTFPHGPGGGMRKSDGYKGQVFTAIPHAAWIPLEGYGPDKG